MVKGIALTLGLLFGASAYAQTSARLAPIEAEIVKEPLQKKSVTFQRLRRAYLLQQLNRILPTQDTAEGLVITLPDSLLSNPGGLLPSTTARLAKIAETLPPDVTVRVLGYTDEQGYSAANERSSYGRAQAVSDVLSDNDDVPRSIAVAGFVSSTHIPGRDSRRVEIVIAGDGIGALPVTPRNRVQQVSTRTVAMQHRSKRTKA